MNGSGRIDMLMSLVFSIHLGKKQIIDSTRGYKCKVCELFPEGVTFSNRKNKFKFSHESCKEPFRSPNAKIKNTQSIKEASVCCSLIWRIRTRLSLECLEKSNNAKEAREAKVTNIALEKLLRITVFMVKKTLGSHSKL